MVSATWAKARAKEIRAKIAHKYGAGWEHLSEDQQSNALRSELLLLLMQQDLEKYEAAQEMITRVSSEFDS